MMNLRTWRLTILAVTFLLILQGRLSLAVYLDSNEYRDIVISLSTTVSQKDVDLVKLQEIFNKASKLLFHATKRRSYFSEFIVSIPSGWDESICDGFEVMPLYTPLSEVSIYIQGNSPTITQHSKGCGKRGEVILASKKWMDSGQDENKHARQLVQQWAVYRYGVFEETSTRDDTTCFSVDDDSWRPIGCYNSEANVSINVGTNGLPNCSIPEDFTAQSGSTSSIMYNLDSSEMTDFCDGSKSFPHNPLAETRHNILCDRRPVWKIIENTEDFRYGNNAPVSDVTFIPKVTMKCVYEKPYDLYFLIQNASTVDITTLVTEIRYSLLRFVIYSLSSNTKVALTTFSDERRTNESGLVTLNMNNPENAKTVLNENIRVIDEVDDVCLLCGLRKMRQIFRDNESPNSIVAMITLASSLEKTNSFDLLKELRETRSKLFIFVIEDVPITPVAGDVATTISQNGGLFYLPIELSLLNTKLNVDLVNILRSPFHLEDDVIVVHQSTFPNVVSNFEDSFTLDTRLQGEFVYTLKCNHPDRLDLKESDCSDLADLKGNGYQCGVIDLLKPSNESQSTWKFRFKYLGGIKTLSCSSLATVRLSTGQKNPITFRGWLSHYEVRPGQNALVIYAELLRNFVVVPEARVEAIINTPEPNGILTTVELRDNGNGDPDVRKGDGIFSRYFSGFTTKGVYSVVLKAYLPWLTFSDVLAAQDENPLPYTRITAVNSFVVTENPPSMDIYPPNRIADLKVIAVDHNNGQVTLQWTAPGDDYDHGQASIYEIKQSHLWLSLTEEGFEYTPTFDVMSNPYESGRLEKLEFRLPLSENDLTYFMAIRSLDKQENPSKVSNIVSVFIQRREFETTTPIIQSTITSTVPDTSTSVSTVITTTDGNSDTTMKSTATTTNETTEATTEITIINENCPDNNRLVILASSISGGILLFIILVNTTVCWCYIKKKKPKKLSKRDSMLPPHNTNITYRETEAKTSDDSIEDDNVRDDSGRYCFLTSSIDKRELSNTNRSRTPTHGDYEECRNGFELATALPAYVTSSKHDINPDAEDSDIPIYRHSSNRTATVDDSIEDAEIYHLGLV